MSKFALIVVFLLASDSQALGNHLVLHRACGKLVSITGRVNGVEIDVEVESIDPIKKKVIFRLPKDQATVFMRAWTKCVHGIKGMRCIEKKDECHRI